MVEPLQPEFRQALKEAHPGLTDELIDRFEELLAQRFLLDPAKDPERIRELDQAREKLVEETMPHYQNVWQRFHAERPGHQKPARPQH